MHASPDLSQPQVKAGFCVNCGTPISTGSRFCGQCGQPLTEPADETSQPVSGQPPATDGTVQSPDRAASSPAPTDRPGREHQFAQSTNPSVQEPTGDTHVLQSRCACGHQSEPEASFCPGCGRPLKRSGSAQYRLLCRGPQGQRSAIELQGTGLTIGNADECDLKIPEDSHLSREHAQLSVTGDRIVLEDLLSSNGTYVRVRQPFLLQDGDEILVGATILRLERLINGQ